MTRSSSRARSGSTRWRASSSSKRKDESLSRTACGSRAGGVSQDFPDDCPQSLIDPWWINDPERPLVRGSLVWTYLPHPDQEPRVLVLTGRDDDPTDHRVAKYRIEPLQIKDPPRAPGMPVAALPTYVGEI